jgi:hypothetical protein
MPNSSDMACAMKTNSAMETQRDEEDVTDLQLICMHTQFEIRT